MNYIHYGSKNFDINKFKEIKNRRCFAKPDGGLWASPIEGKFGWKDWCEREEFRDCNINNSFEFKLRNSAKIILLNTVNDCFSLPQIDVEFKLSKSVYPDFEKILSEGIDAIQFNLSNDFEMYWTLYGWDCDSILILNKNVIISK